MLFTVECNIEIEVYNVANAELFCQYSVTYLKLSKQHLETLQKLFNQRNSPAR